MKRTLAALVLVLSAARFAAAEEAYVALGVDGGVDSAVDWIYLGTGVDGGYRFAGDFWLHGSFAALGRAGWGTTDDLTLTLPREASYAILAGVEYRPGVWLVGLGAGYRAGKAHGDDVSGPMLAARAGLDVGSGHLRFRPGVEVLVSTVPHLDGENPLPALGVGVTTAIAYEW